MKKKKKKGLFTQYKFLVNTDLLTARYEVNKIGSQLNALLKEIGQKKKVSLFCVDPALDRLEANVHVRSRTRKTRVV